MKENIADSNILHMTFNTNDRKIDHFYSILYVFPFLKIFVYSFQFDMNFTRRSIVLNMHI